MIRTGWTRAAVQAIVGPDIEVLDAAEEVLRLLGHNRPPLGGVMEEAAE